MADMPKPGETIHGFTPMRQGYIQMLGARTYEFLHSGSGARLLYIQNDDSELGFNLIYRTPQLDERDINHILEHLILSSCRKYPSRDVFFDMDSKSYATFMNGLTDNTFTCYPVCTQSQNQLIKLMDVFLCCMEEPDALKDKNFFLREGVRYELESPDCPLTIQGTVLSEDWGHLTDIQENADSFMAKALYPGQTGSNLLGRAHLHYRDITYEQVQKTFQAFYDYSNCLIVLYGDMDYEKMLEFLHREHLSKAGKRSIDLSGFMDEPPVPGYTEKTMQSPAYLGSPVKQACIIDYAVDLSDCAQEDLIYWDLLADMLDSDTSPVHRYAREAGLNNVIEVYLDTLLIKPSLKFRLRNGDEPQKKPFRDSIQSALKEISLHGIPAGLYNASIKEDRLSDALTREAPHLGFHVSEEIGRYWSQTGKTDYFELYEAAFARFSADEEQSIVKGLAVRVLKPRTSALIVTVPAPGMAEALEKEKEDYLRQKKASLTKKEQERLMEETKSFCRWNAVPFTNMDFVIQPDELPQPEKPVSYSVRDWGAITCYTAPAPAQEVGTYQIYFDLSPLSLEDLKYLSLYQMLLTELDTQRYSVEQQKTLEQEYLHECTFDELYPDSRATVWSRPMMSVFWCGLTEGFEQGLDFLLELMGEADYNDWETIMRVMEKYLPDYDLSKTDNASALAFSLAEGYIRRDCRFRNMINSQDIYYFLKDVLKRLKHDPGFRHEAALKLKHLSRSILQNGPVVFIAAAPEPALKRIEESAAFKLSGLRAVPGNGSQTISGCLAPPDSAASSLPSQSRRIAVCVEAACQEIRVMGDFLHNNGFKGRYIPYLMALADKYLKPAIRYQNSAYDCGIDFYIPTGYFSMWSTADPNVKDTLDILMTGGKALEHLELTAQELDGYILNAYAQAIPPDGTLNRRMRHMRRHMAGIQPEMVNEMTSDIRNARLEHQKEAARVIQSILNNAPWAVVGNERCILKDREYFDEILNYKAPPNGHV